MARNTLNVHLRFDHGHGAKYKTEMNLCIPFLVENTDITTIKKAMQYVYISDLQNKEHQLQDIIDFCNAEMKNDKGYLVVVSRYKKCVEVARELLPKRKSLF